MANLGEITEFVASREFTLEVGSDKYILLKNLDLHIGRTEQRDMATDGGPIYSYGGGDNFFTATLFFSGPEVDGTAFTNSTTAASFNELSQLTSDGDLDAIDWKIVARDVSGSTKTFTATGVLREYDVRKPEEGKVEVDIFVRITGDTVSIA